MKKPVAVLCVLSLLLAACCLFASAGYNGSEEATRGLASGIHYMVSLDDDTVLFNKNETERTAPAAFVKLLAAIVAIEKWENLDEKVEITEESLSLVKYEYGVRTVNLRPDESYTRRQLIEAACTAAPSSRPSRASTRRASIPRPKTWQR